MLGWAKFQWPARSSSRSSTLNIDSNSSPSADKVFAEFLESRIDFLSLKLNKTDKCAIDLISFKAMRKLGKTLDNWKKEIGRMLRFSKTNSITEGLHNKMEMLSRRAFGFRNFENYRLKVRVHCGAW